MVAGRRRGEPRGACGAHAAPGDGEARGRGSLAPRHAAARARPPPPPHPDRVLPGGGTPSPKLLYLHIIQVSSTYESCYEYFSEKNLFETLEEQYLVNFRLTLGISCSTKAWRWTSACRRTCSWTGPRRHCTCPPRRAPTPPRKSIPVT